MTVPDAVETRILEKTSHVADAVSVLASKQSLDRETYRTDREQRAIVGRRVAPPNALAGTYVTREREREFQTAIEACIDIAGILIGTLDVETPETYAERFTVLADAGVLSSETSTRMKRAAGFRNVLVHKYGTDIDDAMVYEHLQTELQWLVTYLHEVKEYLESAGG